MVEGSHPLAAAIAAARAGDLDTLRGLIDWPLTGIGGIAQSLTGVLERDRAQVLATGLAELDSAADRAEIVAGVLRDVAPRLARAHQIERADPATIEPVLARLRVPPLPPGLTEAQSARLAGLGAQAAAIREVFLVITETESLPVAMTPDGTRLVLVLPD
ncbi:MAG: hypothetical protein IRY85_13835 [Micromonosporaceae bacterium]|nr:hypothetical protein [Micromonosporaceae bacterium]